MINEKTTSLIHKLAEEGIVPGVSYAMIKDGYVQSEVFGMEQVVPFKKKLTYGRLYDVASLTKVIGTTTLILHLQEIGKLTVDDRVCDYLEKFSDKRVTLRHLLTHTSALTGYIKNRNELSATELMDALYTLKVGDWFEKKVVYADIGPILLGQIIEKIYGMPVQDAIEQEVLKPLGLKESTFSPSSDKCVPTEYTEKRGLIQGLVHDPKAFILGKHCGSAGLFMSLNDLMRFSNWMLENDPHKPVVSDATIRSLFQDHTPNGHLGRSLGWDLRFSSDGTPCLYHTGFTGTFILIDKKRQSALIVLTNRVHPTSDNQKFLDCRDKIIECYLKENQ